MLNRFTQKLSRKIAPRVARIMMSRKADFEIGTDETYLARWWLIPRNPIFNLYGHVFFRSDEDRALHDHPFPSVSLSLGRIDSAGRVHQDADAALWEVYLDRAGNEQTRRIPCGTLVYRSATFAHRLVVPKAGVMTLFITGPRIREWGFICPNVGWRHWKVFTGYTDGKRGSIGRGCD